MLNIRFSRKGRKNRPFFHIVVADSRFPRDGRYIELLGYYDPLSSIKSIYYNIDRIVFWLKNGAKFSKGLNSIIRM